MGIKNVFQRKTKGKRETEKETEREQCGWNRDRTASVDITTYLARKDNIHGFKRQGPCYLDEETG